MAKIEENSLKHLEIDKHKQSEGYSNVPNDSCDKWYCFKSQSYPEFNLKGVSLPLFNPYIAMGVATFS